MVRIVSWKLIFTISQDMHVGSNTTHSIHASIYKPTSLMTRSQPQSIILYYRGNSLCGKVAPFQDKKILK